jgi:cold shock CspA family protein
MAGRVRLALGFYNTGDWNVRERGEVKMFNEEKGYGFIALDSDEKDIFFHCKQFIRQTRLPCKGDILEFEVAPGRDGRLAAKGIEFVG